VKALADAGVPLARIRELLAAPPAEFAAAVAEIDESLRRRADEIRRTRRRIAQLQAGDRLFVSPEVAAYLERLQALGIGERTVGLEREIWILLQAVSPDRAAEWAADKLAAIEDPSFQSLYRDYDAAFDWSPDDPRLPELAARTRDWFESRSPEAATAPPPDPTITRLAAASVSAYSPAWTRLAELTKAAT